jgi:acetyl esterase/lipase
MAALAAQAAEATSPARGDWRAVRAAASAGLAYMASISPPSSGVTATSFSTPAGDGQGEIEVRWYTTASAAPGPAVVYTHGGGMLGGSVDLYDEVTSWYVAESGVPFLSVELRLAPEATSPTSLAEDVFSGLTWLADHATDLGVDPSRIAVMGDSGGGPTAGAAILARDRDVPVAKQILIYPMLDDRNTTPDSATASSPTSQQTEAVQPRGREAKIFN